MISEQKGSKWQEDESRIFIWTAGSALKWGCWVVIYLLSRYVMSKCLLKKRAKWENCIKEVVHWRLLRTSVKLTIYCLLMPVLLSDSAEKPTTLVCKFEKSCKRK